MLKFGNKYSRFIARGDFKKWFVKIDSKNGSEILG